ncbi:MAG TPA: hypothetical protein VHU44_01815 [Acidobacteriaceae bacterium]|jgi:hypothetical protein|nr:hypothetical protein [Acidobacteriaceae bacterium]
MKLIVRSLVVALAVTGAIASSYAKAPIAKVGKTSAMPVPGCAPGTSTCGFGNW